MDSFAPEFSRYWLPASGQGERVPADRLEDEKLREQQQALEELADRVTAARTVV